MFRSPELFCLPRRRSAEIFRKLRATHQAHIAADSTCHREQECLCHRRFPIYSLTLILLCRNILNRVSSEHSLAVLRKRVSDTNQLYWEVRTTWRENRNKLFHADLASDRAPTTHIRMRKGNGLNRSDSFLLEQTLVASNLRSGKLNPTTSESPSSNHFLRGGSPLDECHSADSRESVFSGDHLNRVPDVILRSQFLHWLAHERCQSSSV